MSAAPLKTRMILYDTYLLIQIKQINVDSMRDKTETLRRKWSVYLERGILRPCL